MPPSASEPAAHDAPLRVAHVAVEGAPLHLGDTLDYRADADLRVGHRVTLNLAGRTTRGLVTAVDTHTDLDPARLRPVGRRLGDVPWTDADGIDLLRWAAHRYGAPLGDVVRHALPGRVVDEERRAAEAGWWPPAPADTGGEADTGDEADTGGEGRIAAAPDVVSDVVPDVVPSAPPFRWDPYGDGGAALARAATDGHGAFLLRPAPGEDLAAAVADLAARTLAAGRSVLVLVPGPVSAVADAVLTLAPAADVLDLRGGPSARLGYRGWLRARAGRVRVVVGERAAAFTPVVDLGLAVVVDEADPTHKERRSPRHHARDVVLERARRAGAVGLCTADVPSARLRALTEAGRVRTVAPTAATVAARRPVVRLETGALEARARISRAGLRLLREAVEDGGYGIVLAARRGEGRALVCTRCRDLVRCTSCRASVARAPDGGWWCATCGARSRRPPRCERCGPGELAPLAAGAERLGTELARSLPVPVTVLEGHAPAVPPAPGVLVMTRGSVLDRPPGVGPVRGVVLPDVDGALRRPTLDAAEDTLRLAFRVAGWTVGGPEGAPDTPGTSADPRVVVETRDPEHHALAALRTWDVDAFWSAETAQRAPLGLPPLRTAVRLEAPTAERLEERLRGRLAPGDAVVGPLPLTAGRAAILILCEDRAATLTALRPLRDVLSRQGADVRLDVDPVDLG